MRDRILILLYLITTLVFLFGVVLSFYNYSYYGYYTDKIINWIWLGFTVVLISLIWKSKIIKIYFFSLVTSLLLSIVPMAIPFFGILNYFSTNNDYQQMELGKGFRIEITKQQALSSNRAYIYEQVGILEKNICRPIFNEIVDETLSVEELERFNEDIIHLIQKADLLYIGKDSIGIEYRILDESKLIYHKLNREDGY